MTIYTLADVLFWGTVGLAGTLAAVLIGTFIERIKR